MNTELVKAPNHQNQSLPIVASTSDASLRLRPYTPTLMRPPIDTQTYYQWDSAGSIQSEAVFRTIGKTQPAITLAWVSNTQIYENYAIVPSQRAQV